MGTRALSLIRVIFFNYVLSFHQREIFYKYASLFFFFVSFMLTCQLVDFFLLCFFHFCFGVLMG